MNNLNQEDIYEYQKRTTTGLFQVEEVEIIDVDNGEEKDLGKWWAVSMKIDPTLACYEVRNKQVAEDLCRELNLLTHDFMFDKTLPEPLRVMANLTDSEFYYLANIINDKHNKLDELATSIENELKLELEYQHESNKIRLNPEFIKEDLQLSKLPTEKQINAYIENKLAKQYDLWKIAKANTSLLRQQLDYINDRISFEKYCLRSRWIK